MFSEGLGHFLANDAGIVAVLGATRKDKAAGVWAQLAPSTATCPYLVYSQISGKPVMSYQGANRLAEARYRISCYGATYGGAKKLAEAVRKAFATFTGTLSDGTVLQNATNTMEADSSESIPHGTVWSTHLDFEFMYLNES